MYDFAPDPIWFSLYVYEENFVFFSISVVPKHSFSIPTTWQKTFLTLCWGRGAWLQQVPYLFLRCRGENSGYWDWYIFWGTPEIQLRTLWTQEGGKGLFFPTSRRHRFTFGKEFSRPKICLKGFLTRVLKGVLELANDVITGSKHLYSFILVQGGKTYSKTPKHTRFIQNQIEKCE